MNIQHLMKQAQQMQKKMQEEQAILVEKEFEGSSGNNAIVVVIKGTGLVKSIKIDKNLVIPEEKDILEDLLIVAFNEARKKLDKTTEDTASGFDPKKLKLPF